MYKGKIVKIQDFEIQLPDVPDKSEILFSELPTKDQKWKRQEYSQFFHDFIPYTKRGVPYTKVFQAETFYDGDQQLVSLNEKDSLLVQNELRQENYRREYGVYAMINGAVVWICPDYYYCLQWCQMKDLPAKYGNFRFVQNDFLTVFWWCLYHPWITSLFLSKCKKSGVTQIMSGMYLNRATQMKGAELLLASKEYDHVIDVALAYFFHSYDNLPRIMQPTSKNRNQHEIKFGKPIGAPTLGTYLDSRVAGMKTKYSCFDGPVVKIGWVDEPPKAWSASKVAFQEWFNKLSETVKLQQKKNGLLVFTSYMPETDDRGFYEFRDKFNQSDYTKLDPNTGQTQTGGVAMIMTAIESNEDCFDEYGHCDHKKAYKMVTDGYNSKKTRQDRQAHKRQYPTCKDDMFNSGGKGKTFDNIRLAYQYTQAEQSVGTGILPYKFGDLRWENSLWETGEKGNRRPQGVFGPVYFEELSESDRLSKEDVGTVKVFQELPDEFLNIAIKKNRRNFDDGHLEPGLENSMVGSFDPSDYVLKSDVVEFSQNAGHVGFIHDPKLETMGIRTNVLCFEYHFRHEDPDDTLEDLVKLILYTNGQFIIEANKKWLITAIKKEGLHHFLLLKQKDGSIKPYQEGDENSLVNTNVEMIEAYCRAINRYFTKPRNDNGIDYITFIMTLALLMQLMDFDVTNTKKYDLVVSFGYWRLAVESFSVYINDMRARDDYNDEALEHAMEFLL